MNKKELIEKALAGKATEEEYKALLWGELEKVDEEEYGHEDNIIWTLSILKDAETGKTYALDWGFDGSDWGEHDFESARFYEVEQKEVVVKQWVEVEENK